MSQSTAAARYAAALFEVAKEHGVTSSVEQDLREIKQVFTSNREVFELFGSPRLEMEQKQNLITQLFGEANPFVLNTLRLVMQRKRMNEMAQIADKFIELSNDDKGIAEAVVYSTRALSEEERAAISDSFAKQVGKRSLRIENVIDPSLIGGLRLQIGNRIFDSSISAKLARLQRQLIG